MSQLLVELDGCSWGIWSVPGPVSSCNTWVRGSADMLRGIVTTSGPFLAKVTVVFKMTLVTSRSPFFSKGGELERRGKGSCRVTFSLGMDKKY